MELHLLLAIVLLPAASALQVIDLSHAYNNETLAWPTNRPFELTVVSNDTFGDGGWYASNDIRLSEHTGTHLDAPTHFASGPGIYFSSTIPADRLVAPLHLIDLSSKVTNNRDYKASASDITKWEENYGEIQQKSVVIFTFGWAQYWPNHEDVFGSESKNTTTFHFPGISMEAAQMLADRNVYGVGTDTPSIDYGPSQTFPVHLFLLAKNIYFLENVADTSELPEAGKGVTLVSAVMKIDGGSGGPVRLLALVDKCDGGTNSVTFLGANRLLIAVIAFTIMWSHQ